MIKRIVSFLCCCFVVFSFLIPSRVRADSPTYYEIPANDEFKVFSGINSFINAPFPVRAFIGINKDPAPLAKNDYITLVVVSPKSSGVLTSSMIAGGTVESSGDYYVGRRNWTYSNYYGTTDLPILYRVNFSSNKTCISYTYGENAVSPSPSIEYGPLDCYYTTNIAGQGMASGENLDVIHWELIDKNGNDLSQTGAVVKIRALYGGYEAESKNSLLLQTWQDFVNWLGIHELGEFPIQQREASFSWYEIIEAIDNLTLVEIVDDKSDTIQNLWYRKGWYFEIQYIIDDYYSPWQKLYTVTSSGVENMNEIINNSSTYNFNTYKALQTITTINESSTVNYTINNNVYNIQNENITNNENTTDTTEQKDPSFWDYLLSWVRSIPEKLNSILNYFKDLFNFGNTFEIEDIDEETEEALENKGIVSEVFSFRDDFRDLIDSFNGEPASPLVLSYSGVVIDNVQLLPAVDLDFSNIYSYLGVEAEDIYFFTDAIIYSSLIFLVYRRVMSILRGGV